MQIFLGRPLPCAVNSVINHVGLPQFAKLIYYKSKVRVITVQIDSKDDSYI